MESVLDKVETLIDKIDPDKKFCETCKKFLDRKWFTKDFEKIIDIRNRMWTEFAPTKGFKCDDCWDADRHGR